MRSKLLPLCMAALLTGAGGLAVADDGVITNKSMSRTIKLPDFTQEIVNNHVPEAEHAYTDMMLFYVPMQAASGDTEFVSDPDETDVKADPRDYYNIDEELVETLAVASLPPSARRLRRRENAADPCSWTACWPCTQAPLTPNAPQTGRHPGR